MLTFRKPVLFFFICLVIISTVNAGTELKIATSRWSPYVDDQLPNSGIAMDVMTAVFKKAGYTLNIRYEK